MASFNLRIANSVDKDLRQIDRDEIPRLYEAIRALTKDPFPEGKFKKLHGADWSFRVRVGDYRILYEVDMDTKAILVFRVRHRKDVYR